MKAYKVISKGSGKPIESALFQFKKQADYLANDPLLQIGNMIGVSSHVEEVHVPFWKWLIL